MTVINAIQTGRHHVQPFQQEDSGTEITVIISLESGIHCNFLRNNANEEDVF